MNNMSPDPDHRDTAPTQLGKGAGSVAVPIDVIGCVGEELKMHIRTALPAA